MPKWFTAVWPVAVFFLGQASTYLTGFITEKRRIAQARQALRDDRNKAITDRRETFELDHLVRLNEALQDLARAATQIHLVDMRTSGETGHYAGTLLPDGLSDNFMQAGRTVRMLRNLVLDDDLRTLVIEAAAALHRPSMMLRAETMDARQVFDEAVDLVDTAQEAVAERIRKIYASAEA
ncbi:hypothetical protein [Streptomyces pseudovenezuelae]|uniref:hypothetical protein n=1 Tax=Streptomyces pseudovenezuelae TaxID=67350 RepID=UPI002E818619|nr:hypothetical protein [Streptomyces pseudovenezuelae]WUA85795.1 hypothetical protein OHO81_00050 [Streptomyces pseudovenezuelae]WUA93971.1 hypothetical protein OHO81_44565 [Streptomyces pseudovenezuelae]